MPERVTRPSPHGCARNRARRGSWPLSGSPRNIARAWDYLHCPPDTAHNTIGAAEEPCAILMVRTRSPDHRIRYLVDAAAAARERDRREVRNEGALRVLSGRDLIRRALERYKGNRKRAAEALDISTVTLWRKMKEYDLAT